MPKINKFKHRKTIMASTSCDENEDDAPFKFSFQNYRKERSSTIRAPHKNTNGDLGL